MVAREHASCFAFTHFAPPVPAAAWLERTHLLDLLSLFRIAVLCAPPGYGKTALAAQWAARQPACGWLSLGSEPVTASLLLPALCRAWLHEDLPPAVATAAEQGEALLVLEHLAMRFTALAQPRLLVLDAADACDHDLRVALRRFAQGLPAHTRLLLTLRSDQEWHWHAVYVGHSACRLGHHDLQWRSQDLDRLQQQCGQPVVIAAVREWLGHWPAAVGLWMQAGGDWGETSSSRSALIDYCVQERILPLPAAARQLLFHCAVAGRSPLERVYALPAEEVHALVACLLDAALATMESDGARAWLLIPPLIQEAVRRHLQRHEPGELRRLHGCAAREARCQGRHAAALQSSIQAAEPELMSELLQQSGWDLLHEGHAALVQQGLLLLEGQLAGLGVDGVLLHLQMQLQQGEPSLAATRWEALMQQALTLREQWQLPPPQQARYEAGLCCMRLQRALQLADRALARELESSLQLDDLPTFLGATALGLKGERYLLDGQPAEAAAWTRRALQLARQNGHRHQVCGLAHQLAQAETARGQLQRASILRQEALAFARREGLYESSAVEALLGGHVEVCLAMQHDAEAHAALQQLLQLRAAPSLVADVLSHHCYPPAADSAHWQASISRLCQVDPCVLAPALRVRVEQVLLDVWMRTGDRERVQLWLGLLSPLVEPACSIAQFDGRNRLRALAWLARKQAFAALADLLLQHAGQLPSDLALLRALRWEHGMDDGRNDWLPALTSYGYVAELRRLEQRYPERWARVAADGGLAGRPQLQPLLDRKDCQLLQYLEQGLSNEWIAEHMHMAMGTVKNRLTQIYRRLGVHNRAQAVHWWRFHREQG